MDRFAKLHPQVKRVVVRLQRCTREAAMRTRCDIVLDADAGFSKAEIARRRRVARSTVYRVLERFAAFGLAGLYDWRRENGRCKIDEAFLRRLDSVVRRSPQDFGRPRPTWTRELLVAVMAEETGVAASLSAMSRALAKIEARRGRRQRTAVPPTTPRSVMRATRATRRQPLRGPRRVRWPRFARRR